MQRRKEEKERIDFLSFSFFSASLRLCARYSSESTVEDLEKILRMGCAGGDSDCCCRRGYDGRFLEIGFHVEHHEDAGDDEGAAEVFGNPTGIFTDAEGGDGTAGDGVVEAGLVEGQAG